MGVVLLAGAGQLEQREEAEGMPVQVAVGVQLHLLAGRGVAGAVFEAQVIIDLGRGDRGTRVGGGHRCEVQKEGGKTAGKQGGGDKARRRPGCDFPGAQAEGGPSLSTLRYALSYFKNRSA